MSSPLSPPEPPARPRFRWAQVPPLLAAAIPVALLIGIVVTLAVAGLGFGWLLNPSVNWNPSTGDPSQASFGILVFVVGSFVTALPALVLVLLLSLAIGAATALYLPRRVSLLLNGFVDLLAGIPSVVYGIWGFWIVAPVFGTTLNPWINTHLGFVPGLGGPVPSTGIGIPLAIFVLTLMALPLTAVLVRESLLAVPVAYREAGLALGATRYEVFRRILLPFARRRIGGAALLGFGRALGETVAVFMVIGDATKLPFNFFDLSFTVPGVLVGQFDSAFIQPNYLAALAQLGLVLLAFSLVINVGGRWLVGRVGRGGIAMPEAA